MLGKLSSPVNTETECKDVVNMDRRLTTSTTFTMDKSKCNGYGELSCLLVTHKIT